MLLNETLWKRLECLIAPKIVNCFISLALIRLSYEICVTGGNILLDLANFVTCISRIVSNATDI